jgi:hypothetical protein
MHESVVKTWSDIILELKVKWRAEIIHTKDPAQTPLITDNFFASRSN